MRGANGASLRIHYFGLDQDLKQPVSTAGVTRRGTIYRAPSYVWQCREDLRYGLGAAAPLADPLRPQETLFIKHRRVAVFGGPADGSFHFGGHIRLVVPQVFAEVLLVHH